MTVKLRGGRYTVDTRWPDGLRFRRTCPDENTAQALGHQISVALTLGQWQDLRTRLERPVTAKELLLKDLLDE